MRQVVCTTSPNRSSSVTLWNWEFQLPIVLQRYILSHLFWNTWKPETLEVTICLMSLYRHTNDTQMAHKHRLCFQCLPLLTRSVPLDLEHVGRWEEEGGAAFTEGRVGGERSGFDGRLHRTLGPGRAVANSSCSHIPGPFHQPSAWNLLL